MNKLESISSNKQNYTVIILGFTQGIILYFLHNLLEQNVFNDNNLSLWLPIYIITILLPLTFQLVFINLCSKTFWVFIITTTIVLALTGVYTGNLATEKFSSFTYVFYFTSFIAWFIAIPFLQSCLNKTKNSYLYTHLYNYSWKNFILILETCIFVLLLWILFKLCASLFDIISINFFSKLIAKKWFQYIVTSTTFAISVCILQNNESMIIFLRKHILNLLKWLLPINAIILILFILFLPFTGLEPLLNTHSATTIILTLIIWMIILLNASYQDSDNDIPFGKTILIFIKLAICTLPIYSSICIYALYLRITQHGWSVDRIWASIIILVITIYAIGYAYSAITNKNKWFNKLSTINIFASLVIVIILILTNTPFLSPTKIAANSQISRLLDNKIPYELFDYYYFKYDLGKIGFNKLKELETLSDSKHKEAASIRKKVNIVLNDQTSHWQRNTTTNISIQELEKKLKLFPAGQLDNNFLFFLQNSPYVNNYTNNENCIILSLDLNHDNINEYILINQYAGNVFKKNSKNGWQYVASVTIPYPLSWDSFISYLQKKNFKSVAKKFDNILVGKYLLRTNED